VHRHLYLVVEASSGPPEALSGEVRRILAEADPDVVPGPFQSMAQVEARSPSVARTTLLNALLAQAAVIALLLSAVALYGVVAYSVRQRTREIGLRVALGADRRRLVGSVMGEAASVGAVGLLLGIVGIAAVGRVLGSVLFEVQPTDPLTLSVTAVLLGAVTVAAAFVPSRRATRVDPCEALRAE
jgi:putative ABC transport system permease protein